MKYLHLLLCAAMLGFAAVQYNDPDALLWIVYYLVPAAWTGLAALRPEALRLPKVERWLVASLVAWLGLVVFYWPSMPNFWLKQVWMAEETAREGMGLMIAWLTLLVAWIGARLGAPRRINASGEAPRGPA
jgi:hypothetical protein